MGVGNLPADNEMRNQERRVRLERDDPPFERPGPSRRGICLIKLSEDRKASYFFASFLTNFLFLLSLEHNETIKAVREIALFTSSSHQPSYIPAQSAWRGQRLRHPPRYIWKVEDEER